MTIKHGINRILITLLGFLLLTACGEGGEGVVATTTTSTTVTKTATLTLAAEVPAPIIPQAGDLINGTGTVTLNTATNAITGRMTITGNIGRVTMAHIHDGNVGVAGPVVIPLQNTGNGIWVVPAGSTLTDPQVVRFLAGGYYLNVHTLLNVQGEIRGQLN